ncbi:contactin-associated protein 1-like, partial [Anneissia japonica]|uniref:contactin-associated protein 1-like n=1 Tax=Anneissia japonica TaxID=1529436 RepID=UPI001425B9B3
IGAFFHDSTGILAKLNQPSTPDTASLEVDYFLISFSTNGGSGVMAYVRSARDVAQQEYIVVYLTEVGNVVAKVNIGNNEYTVQELDSYNDGYRHLIILRRYGNRIMMSVDNKESAYKDISPAGSDIQFMSRDLFVVGGIESNLTGFGLDGLTGFDGCLSGVDYNGNMPIKTFYMSTAAIEDTSESLKKGICAGFLTPIVFVPSEPPSIEQPEITLPPWNVLPAQPIISGASTAVSYTHLDVYKRQISR